VRDINNTEQILISLLGSEVCQNEIKDGIKVNITEKEQEELFMLAKSHDMTPIVANALFKNSLMPDGDFSEIYRSHLMTALFRHQQQAYEFSRIAEMFEKEQIPYMPLKGLVIKELYSEPHLRTSCDMDILVKKEDLDRAAYVLTEILNYENTFKGAHDWGFRAENGVYAELHYELIEGYENNEGINTHSWSCDCLENVWKTATNTQNKKFCFEMQGELFYFYHIAHMAKHFEGGGCGVKPFLDLWLINNKMNFDRAKCTALLEKDGLLKFENVMQRVVDVWFSGAKADDVVKDVENFIFSGGVYGSTQNYINVQKSKAGGRVKYIFSRMFLTYDFLRIQYPVLNKHRWLMPACQVARWTRLIFKGKLERSVNEIKQSADSYEGENDSTKKLLHSVGLD